jgi:hypothetical protein
VRRFSLSAPPKYVTHWEISTLQNEKQLLAVMNFIYETQRGAAIESHFQFKPVLNAE